ncbi:MAG: VanZ family protein [Fibromonadaceae bacterium]|nr:VanZ family protein [Fibromonadaceae bacterium]
MAAILALSTLPGNDPLLKTFEFSDKIKHVVAYFVLGISFCLWIPSKKWLAKPFLWGITVVVLCTVFGILDEYHQSFRPGRSGNDLGDIIANFIGGLIAAITYCIAVHIIKRRVKVSGST